MNIKRKDAWILIPLSLMIGWIIYQETTESNIQGLFFGHKVNSLICKVNSCCDGRGYEYATNSGIVFLLPKRDSLLLQLGDSIAKEKDTWEFYVYRDNSNGLGLQFHKKINAKR